MNNEFRVWDKITQSYGGGDLWSINSSGELFYGNAKWPEGITEQYTGLKDKNGKKIFEGDVIQTNVNGDIRKGVVYYEDAQWFGSGDYLGYAAAYSGAMIIGNIHDTEDTAK